MSTPKRMLGAIAVLLTSAVAIGAAAEPAAAAYPDHLRTNAIVPIQPARLMDTRSGSGISTVDGQHVGTGRGTSWKLQVAGRGGIPADAQAAVLNVTAIQPARDGFVTMYPCGTDRPTASNINYRRGQIVPNAVVTKLDADGAACVYSSSATHVAVDANGFVPRLGRVGPLEPARVLDTRPGLDTADGEQEGVGRLPADSTVEVQVTGRVGVPDGAGTVLVNATAIGGSGPGYLTIFPCGTPRPNASSINYLGGDVIPNLVAAKIGGNGRICVYTLRDVDVAIDVAGFVPADGDLTTVDPARIVDTRAGHRTIDGDYQAFGRLAPNDPLKIDVAGRARVPANASAVLLNVGAVYPGGPGFLKVYPCDERPPQTSNVNYFGGDVQSNAVLSKVAADGTVCLITSKRSDVIVDVNGFVPPAAYRTSMPYVETISSCAAEFDDATLVDGTSHSDVLLTGERYTGGDCPDEIAFVAFDLSRRICRITTTVAPTEYTGDGRVIHARIVTPGGQVLQSTSLARDQKAGLNVSVRGLNRVRLETHDEHGSEIAWVDLEFHYCTTADGTPTTVQQPFVETRTSKPAPAPHVGWRGTTTA